MRKKQWTTILVQIDVFEEIVEPEFRVEIALN